jgi:hypothetical protein
MIVIITKFRCSFVAATRQIRMVALTILFSSAFLSTQAQISKRDSCFTLGLILAVTTNNIDEHGVDFFENNKRLDSLTIANDFSTIRTQASLDLSNYKVKYIKKGKQLIKCFESNDKTKASQLVEVVTREFSKNKKIQVEVTNYLIMSKKSPYLIELEFNENGVNYYKIDQREVYSVRESIMILDDEIDKSAFKEAKAIINQYKLN